MTRNKSTIWTTSFPKEDGWYWIKYKTKNNMLEITPAQVLHWPTKDITCSPARGGFFTEKNRMEWKDVKFGPKIPMPE